jgi:hypothetical protein
MKLQCGCLGCEEGGNHTHCTVWCFMKPKKCVVTPSVNAEFKQTINTEKSFLVTLPECFGTPDERWADSHIRSFVEEKILSYHGKTIRVSIEEKVE